MKLHFTKMHGAGNDFVVVDATRIAFKPVPTQLAKLADRHFGAGCDQILVVEPASDPDVDFDYRIYNSDGSESGQCGNGARCLLRFIHERGISAKKSLRVRTISQVLELEKTADGQTRVNMGVPRFAPGEIPLSATQRQAHYALNIEGKEIRFGAANMGNPHAVIEVADVERAPVAPLGAALQAHVFFPQSVNVGFMQIVDAGTIHLRVNERGVGETLACGSGACAAVAAGRLWGKLGERVRVQMRGGELGVEWAGEGQSLYLSGPAVTVYQGEMEI
ncbi:MAG: diaminopimelate epimerase [Pseudomonadota bacterium]